MKSLNQFLDEGALTLIGKKKPAKKAEKAMDAGAKARRLMKRREHAKYVSGSEDNVPDDIREGIVDAVKKGAKRHSKAVEKKKIRNRKAVPYAALAAQHEPDGELVEGDVHSGQGEKIQKRTKAWMDKKGQSGAPGLDAMKARTAEHKAKRGVKEEVREGLVEPKGVDSAKEVNKATRKAAFRPFNKEDKAFDYVVAKLKKQHGDGVLTKGDKMPEPSAAQKKKNAEIRAKRAKEDHRDPTEKASSG